MAATESRASWHPAFMPNSVPNLTSSNLHRPSFQSLPSSESLIEQPKPLERIAESAPSDSVDSRQDVIWTNTTTSVANNDQELKDPLLTASLASPNDVGIYESPMRDSATAHRDFNITSDSLSILDKAESPSEGLARKPEHGSSASFARTVPYDKDWGEDDETDPERNLHKTETDPFKLMASSNRTNLFPQVPPAHNLSNSSLDHAPPKSQAREIISEAEHPHNFFSEDDATDNFFGHVTENDSASHPGVTIALESQSQNPQNNIEGNEYGLAYVIEKNVDEPQAEERYEEGLPPVENTTLEDRSTEGGNMKPALSGEANPVEEDDFFGETAGSGDSRALRTGQDESMLSPNEPSAEDLAAKWEAVLAGDELLEDELLDDELLDDSVIPENIAVDPATLFGSDDEGFLDDDEPALDQFDTQLPPILPTPIAGSDGRSIVSNSLPPAQQRSSNNRYLPPNANQTPVQYSGNTFVPQAPLLTDLSVQPGGNSLSVGAPPRVYGAPQQQRPELPKPQSFADKSKGGYSSPYDLPMEVVKLRKRSSMHQTAQGYNNIAPTSTIPPPRRSSMVTQGLPPSRSSTSSMSPPVSSSSLYQGPAKPLPSPASNPQHASRPSVNSSAGFFAELPITSRPKPAGRYTTQPSPSTIGEQRLQTNPPAYHAPQPTPHQSAPATQGLVAPQKVGPFMPLQTGQPQPPVLTTRYSPALSRSSSGSAPPPAVGQGRYAAAPPSLQQSSSFTSTPPAPSPPAPFLAHQPRTSSPLVHFERTHDQRSIAGPTPETGNTELLRREGSGLDRPSQRHPPQSHSSPPRRVASNYSSDVQPGNVYQEPPFVPPERSQSQSPAKVIVGSRADIGIGAPHQHPVVHSPTSPRQFGEQFPSISAGIPKSKMRGPSQVVNYIAPTDGREHDPLKRWRGAPIFAWGVGGTIVTSFPKQIPRYGVGQTQPMILCSPGEVKVRNLKDIYPLEERLAGFPGPLKGKSKKKEVIAWLTAGIGVIERENIYLRSRPTLIHEEKRKVERLLLWQILRVMVENDGLLEGNPVVNKAVRGVLSPGLDREDNMAVPQYTTGSDLPETLRAKAPATLPEPVNPPTIDQLKKYLLQGEREKAVWEAVDKRLWAHAMLISNTLSREVHKQVAQEFIQKEVKGVGENTESLAALYEIFAGNFEESVDELVPPSARAGLQMVSTSGTSGSSKSSLAGLDSWRETLGLVLSNRSLEDIQAINALGKLLSGYGRAEAAHICFLFSRGYSVFGGVDDPQSNIVLVGSDHLRQPHDFDKELEPTLLSEVYEYALSLSAISNLPFSAPHLAVYKLQHASVLAEFGQREKALQYCEVIANSITSQVRRSPYHNTLLITALDDLSKRLKQSPKDESSSWIPKPSIDKVSGSLWGKFNKFVAGEDDAASGGAGSEAGSEVGPFARIAGDTPIISRSPSNSDIHRSFNGPSANGSVTYPPPTKSASKYAPTASHTPPDAHDPSLSTYNSQPQGPYTQRLSPEYARSESASFGYQPKFNDQTSRSYPNSAPSLPSSSYGRSSSPYLGSPYVPQHPNAQSHEQFPSSAPRDSPPIPSSEGKHSPLGYIPTAAIGYEPPTIGTYESHSNGPYGPQSNGTYEPPSSGGYDHLSNGGYEPPPSGGYEPPPSGGYEPLSSGGYEPPSSGGYEPPSSGGYEPPSSGGYEPPSSGGYEPPSYEPAPMGDELDSPIDTRSKKQGFMYDDDDELAQPPPAIELIESKTAAASKVEKSKAEKDKESDEAFRKAAEADAKKDASAPAKKGWGLGGWFSKKESTSDGTQPNKPIRAKLGEESSFVYDPELKRWVNKKAGKDGAQEGSSSTPPPPRAGPPRSVSGTLGSTPTPSEERPQWQPPPQRAVSASATSTHLAQPDAPSGLMVPTSTPMGRSASNGSATGPPSGPPSRPATSMSNASSIDDLLGPPTARKGTAKKPKRGRGYIDVMEKTST